MDDTENKINQEIIRRAIERSSIGEQEKKELHRRQSVIDALEEVTDLTRSELEDIAREVRESYASVNEDFFSIKQQFKLVALFGSLLMGIIAVVVWLLLF